MFVCVLDITLCAMKDGYQILIIIKFGLVFDESLNMLSNTWQE